MWNWFNCYLSGRHDYGIWCEPGTIYLRCLHCGKRSSGWAIYGNERELHATPAHTPSPRRTPRTGHAPAGQPLG